MTIDNLVRLIQGELLTTPCISSFNEIKFSVNKVSLGDLFVYTGLEDIQKAVEKGAYAVLFDKDTNITDYEIAWIKVKSLKTALVRILRLYLREKSIHIYYIDEIKIKILKSIVLQREIIILEEMIFDTFQKLFNAKENSIAICSDENMLKNIYPDYKTISTQEGYKIKIINNSVFETTFIYKEKFFKNIKLPKIFINELQKILFFLEEQNIGYELSNLNFIENHFDPIFINNKFIQKPFGTTQKVLIFEKNYYMIEKEIIFLKNEAKWAQISVFFPTKNSIKTDMKIFIYKNFEDIKLQKEFHFGIIFDNKKDFIPKLSDETEKQKFSLFKELS